MKNLVFAFLLLSLGASAQTSNQAKSLCLSPACPISFAYGVSDTVFVEINASDGNGISYWRQLSGPAIALPKDTTIWTTSIQAYDGFYLSGAPAGAYVLQDSVVTKSGSMAKATVSFTVLPPTPACPVCPAIPPPRSVTSLTFSIAGVSVTIPAAGVKFTYDNGTTQ